MMRRPRPQPIRNKLDLADSRQVRSMKKRLRLSEDQLNEIVGRIGNSDRGHQQRGRAHESETSASGQRRP
jgi:hypothetical protein